MARPSRTGGKTSEAKTRKARPEKGRKSTKTKPRIAPAATRVKRRSVSDPSKDLKEAREQQAATAEILKVIASSPNDVQPVFDAIVANADRLISGFTTGVYRFVDDIIHLAAITSVSPDADAALKAQFPRPAGDAKHFRMALAGEVWAVADTEAQPDKPLKDIARVRGFRSVLYSPLMSNGKSIGVIVVSRRNAGPFSAHHVQLLQTFADQAVIAIENTRLFNVVRQRTNDLSEALQQQTATADVLKVIASSPTDVGPTLRAIVEGACRFCDAYDATVLLKIEDHLHYSAHHGPIPVPREAHRITRQWVAGRSVVDKVPVQISDFLAPEAAAEFPEGQRRALEQGHRCTLAIPLLQEGEAVGAIGLRRLEPVAFSTKQVRLLQNFADQAVIAIQNTRLFNETQEALERQTATADILKVIASSPSDVQPVFEAIAASANRLIGGFSTAVFRFIDGVAHLKAFTPTTPEADEVLKNTFPMPVANFPLAQRNVMNGETDQIHDTETGEEFQIKIARARGFRSIMFTPLMHQGTAIGMISTTRRETGRFADHHVQLLQTFADQAVIAIENVRLFNEVKQRTDDLTEALEQQTATSEVLGVISQSLGQVEPVFRSMLANGMRICEAQCGAMFSYARGAFRAVSCLGGAPDFETFLREERVWGCETGMGRVAQTKQPVHVVDTVADRAYADQDPSRLAAVEIGGVRTFVIVPMLKDGELIGAMSLYRRDVRAYTEKQIKLVSTFADQAVIAIENARLFDEVQAKTRDLTEALTHQTGSANILSVIASSPTDVGPVLKAIVESACQLCDAYDAAVVLQDGEYLRISAHHGPIPIGIEKWPINRRWTAGRAFVDQTPVHIEDLSDEKHADFTDGRELSLRMGHRTILSVPLLREGESIGAIVLRRTEVHPFSDKQIALLQSFADQAVIAIGNVRLFDEVQAKTRDLTESLEQQTATSEVLEVISASTGELEPVFQKMLENATRVCGANFGTMSLYEAGSYQNVALYNVPDASAQQLLVPFRPHPKSGLATVARTLQAVQTEDLRTQPPYLEGHPAVVAISDLAGARTLAIVPMLRENELIGTIAIYRKEVQRFTDKQVELVANFAKQAVIAIENTRLLKELRQRTDDLSEALTYQTGSGNILKVIASSPTDVAPTLKAIVESACEICDGNDAVVFLKDGGDLVFSAHHGPIPINLERWPINRKWITGRAAVDKAPQHIHDLLGPEGDDFPEGRELQRNQGQRTVLSVPLLQEGEAIGVISLRRIEVQPFNDKQIELLKSFADQAVIAISNVELFKEVQARTADLQESLQQQTATADVLKVISRSSVDLATVLDTLVDTVARLCRADQVYMFHLRHDLWHLVAAWGLSAEAREFFLTNPFTPGRGSTSGRAALERRAVLIPDVLQDPEYALSEGQKIAGYRTTLGIPLLREDTLIGVFSITRTRVEAFTEKEIELATTFADQAVIAIENARLFEELHDRQAELRVTFDNMGDGVVMFDTEARLTAWNRNFQEMLELPEAFLAGRPSWAEFFRYLADRGEYSTDLEAQLSRTIEDISREMRFERTRPDGRVMEVRRNPVLGGGFVLIYSDITERKHAEEAIRTARDAAEAALRDLQTAQDRLIQTEKLASLGQLTAGIAHEIKNPLNFVNNFSELSAELTDELNDVLKPVTLDGKVREEVDELTGMLRSNLEKVVQHGKRADSIVKNMLLHSREGSREHRAADINSLLDESLNLAYHGARAEKGEFNITLQRDFDAAAGTIELFPQEITRAFLNLIANGVYAATRRKTEDKEPGFEPTLRATTKNLGTTVEIRIRDNGTGIPAEVREKMFNPFFTTKPAGEGTGLGLSMTHDIIVKQHGGRIDVDTKPGIFTEFVITLPRTIIPPKATGGTN